MKTKKCRVCGEVKPITEFAINRGTRDGKHSFCKKCGVVMSYKRVYTYCGLENDITGYAIGKALSSKVKAKYYIPDGVKFTE